MGSSTSQEPGGSELERGQELLGNAEAAVTRAQQRISNMISGPLEPIVDALADLLKYAEHLGIHLNELSDAYRNYPPDSAAFVGGEMAELGRALDEAAGTLATPPDELAARLEAVKTGSGFRALDEAAAIKLGFDPQGVELAAAVRVTVTIQLTAPNFNLLGAAAAAAGVSPEEFATAAVLRAAARVVEP